MIVPILAPGRHPGRHHLLPAPARSPSTRTTWRSPRSSSSGRPSASTTPAATPASTAPRSPCSAACCPARLPRAGRRRGRLPLPARRRAPASAATGSTYPAVRRPGRPWSSATSSGTASHAAATMGRLRTAVRTLADARPAPRRTARPPRRPGRPRSTGGGPERTRGGRRPSGDVGATCLYAVYDPVSRQLHAGPRRPSPARRGAPPDGTCRLPRPARRARRSALGGLPFEAVELDLAEGSLLALYTDGLIEAREPRHRRRPRPAARQALAAAPTASLDETCDAVLDALVPARRAADDVALLLARTQAAGRRPGRDLGPARGSRPVVAEARKQAAAAAGRLGAGRARRSPPNWSSASWSPTPSATASGPIRLRLIQRPTR